MAEGKRHNLPLTLSHRTSLSCIVEEWHDIHLDYRPSCSSYTVWLQECMQMDAAQIWFDYLCVCKQVTHKQTNMSCVGQPVHTLHPSPLSVLQTSNCPVVRDGMGWFSEPPGRTTFKFRTGHRFLWSKSFTEHISRDVSQNLSAVQIKLRLHIPLKQISRLAEAQKCAKRQVCC